jgi:hypothetical protein
MWQSLRWWGFDLLMSPFHLAAPFAYGLYIAHTPILVLDGVVERWPVLLRVIVLGALLVIVANFLERSLYPAVKAALRRRFFTPDLLRVG